MTSHDLRDFLMSRRARIDPTSMGLPESPVARRSSGLRREEVATLAGVSADYYARLEQGRVGQVSDQVLDSVATVLRLDELERAYLRTLVGTSHTTARSLRSPKKVRAGLANLIAAMDPIPVLVQDPHMQIVAWNRAASILLTDFSAMPTQDRNVLRWLFLDPTTKVRYPDWEEVAGATVAALRANRDPRHPDETLERLVGELSVASADFSRFWAGYRLFKHGHGAKRVFHEAVGTITLNYETLEVPGPEGLFMSIYTTDVGSPSDEKLRILLSWEQDLSAVDPAAQSTAVHRHHDSDR